MNIGYILIKRYFQIFIICGMAYHLLALIGLIPLDMVWGGRIKSRDQMVVMEILSFAINTFIIACIHFRYIKPQVLFYKRIFLMLFFIFILNTVGNIFAINKVEAIIFTPITAIMAYCSYRLYLGK